MSPILSLQRQFMTLGRVRLGEKGPRGEPKRLDSFRFTTASQDLINAVAARYGGTPEPWTDAPDGDGYWQVTTETRELNIMLPPVYSAEDGSPTTTLSQWLESWTAAGCARRCDGQTEMLSGAPCLCRPLVEKDGEDARVCQMTTRVSFLLPDLPGVGVWLLTSHGFNAAVELPGTLELLMRAASQHAFIEACLRIENRTRKTPGEPTKRFVVPVIDLPSVTLKQLASGDVPLVLNAPTRRTGPKPPLPETATLPAAPDLGRDAEVIPFGAPPPITTSETYVGAVPEIEPQSVRANIALEQELLEACALLDVNVNDVRTAIEQHQGEADYDTWLTRQLGRARENLALKQAGELAGTDE